MSSGRVRAFRPEGHERHRPENDFSDGYPPVPHPEVPGRLGCIEAGFSRAWPLAVAVVTERAETAVREIHDGDYVDFLLALERTIEPGTELVPSIFHADMTRAPLRFRTGMYCAEIGTPLCPATVDAALRSAMAAQRAADCVVAGDGRALALCRPPGHHAGRRRYGGYCYFNNAYVAARRLNRAGSRVAVLDVDYHLGDGSAEHADERAAYYSLHADPWTNYPYLDAERFPQGPHVHLRSLPGGVTGAVYLEVLDGLLERIGGTGADALVVSLGFDTVASDRIQDDAVALEVGDYRRIGERIAGLGLPTVVVAEGGYDLATLAGCARSFAEGLGY